MGNSVAPGTAKPTWWAGVIDLGLSRKDIHEARPIQVRAHRPCRRLLCGARDPVEGNEACYRPYIDTVLMPPF
jgi:hypothetical protein